MKVLQINAVYKVLSTGRNVLETHEYLIRKGENSYVASPMLEEEGNDFYKIGTKADHKCHAFLSRLTGLQGYYSRKPTIKLLAYIKNLKPDVIVLHNLHSNYINYRIFLDAIAELKIPVVFVLHDCWFFTGKCVYYSEDDCYRWQVGCGNCPALKKGNVSWLFDQSKKMLRDKRRLYGSLDTYAVIGVSNWVTEDARESILSEADIFKTIYNWVDLEKFNPDRYTKNVRKQYDIEGKYIILGVSVSWSEQKGINIIRKIAEALDEEAVIILIGDLDEKYRHSNIISIGRTDNIDELVSWYASVDVMINPSLQETFGKTTAESLACGTPVVGYAGTATAELVGDDGKCGLLVDTQDANKYMESLVIIRENGKGFYKDNCRQRAEKLFDKEINIAMYYRMFNEIRKIANDNYRINK